MKKLLVMLILAGATVSLSADGLKPLAKEISQKLYDAGIKRVAVLDFGKDSDTSKMVQQRLITHLVNLKQVTVIERALLQKLLNEKQLQQTGILDEKTTAELTKVLGVDALIGGSITQNDKKLEVNVRAFATSGKILAASTATLAQGRALAQHSPRPEQPLLGKAVVQIAILLDTSSSMDGLIAQTKTQLWKIINHMAGAEKNGQNPDIEVAIYEYGNDRLKKQEGYIRQVTPFISDFDKISEALFSLKTNGGSEWAGKVIDEATEGLQWKLYRDVYKTMFIAGNEPFTQGPVTYQRAIEKARSKGIVVNTIFCGFKQHGAATGWLAGARMGGGEYMNIQQNMKVARIVAPQDADIVRLGNEMNKTFVPYGDHGRKAAERQKVEDSNASANAASGASIQRSIFKGKKQYARTNRWDLVSLIMNKQLTYDKIDKKKLPAHLRNKSDKEVRSYIENRIKQRQQMQKDIRTLHDKRKKYVAKEKKKRASKSASSIDDAMMHTIQKQAEEMDYAF